jgi:hypothetical protein
MTGYKLTIRQMPAYLHAIVTGLNTQENVAGYLEEIRRACAERGCRRLLIEERLEGPRLPATDVFQIASGASDGAKRLFEAIAYVDVNAQGGLMKFAESVAVNRGVPVRVFSTLGEAEQWLLGQGDAA